MVVIRFWMRYVRRELDKVMLQRGTRGEFEKEVRALCKEYDIPLQYAPKERLQKWTKGNHQGIIGLLSVIPYYKLEDLVPMLYERGRTGTRDTAQRRSPHQCRCFEDFSRGIDASACVPRG